MFAARTKSILTATLCALAFAGAAGCDSDRRAREAAQADLSRHKAALDDAQNQASRIATESAALDREVANIKKVSDELTQTRLRQRAELTSYLADNKAATLALVAAGTGAVVALDDDVKRTLSTDVGKGADGVAMAAGVIGAGYCFFNAGECADVASRIVAYNTAHSETSTVLGRHQQSIASLSQRAVSLASETESHNRRVTQLQEQVESARARLR